MTSSTSASSSSSSSRESSTFRFLVQNESGPEHAEEFLTSRGLSKRSAANRATSKLKEVIIPDVINFGKERKNAKRRRSSGLNDSFTPLHDEEEVEQKREGTANFSANGNNSGSYNYKYLIRPLKMADHQHLSSAHCFTKTPVSSILVRYVWKFFVHVFSQALRSNGHGEWDWARVIIQLRPNCTPRVILIPHSARHPRFYECRKVRE